MEDSYVTLCTESKYFHSFSPTLTNIPENRGITQKRISKENAFFWGIGMIFYWW